MVYEEERLNIKREEKTITMGLIIGLVLGLITGILLDILILGVSFFSIIGILTGSLINIMNRNKKISQ